MVVFSAHWIAYSIFTAVENYSVKVSLIVLTIFPTKVSEFLEVFMMFETFLNHVIIMSRTCLNKMISEADPCLCRSGN